MNINAFIKKYASKIALQDNRIYVDVKREMTNDLSLMVQQEIIGNKTGWCLIIHRWSKWTSFIVKIDGNYGERKQSRVCFRCNKTQEKFLEYENYE